MFSVCVCFGDPCAQNFKLRDYFERLLCGLDHWLSCMLDCIHVCIFLLSKIYFEKLARHLLDTLLSVELLKHFFKRNLNTTLIPGGSIEKAPTSSIAPRHLLDRSSFCSESDSFCSIASSIPTSTDTSIPLDTFICWDLLATYIRPLCDPDFISLRSLSRYFSVSLPKLSHLTPNLFLKDSSSFFKFLLTW